MREPDVEAVLEHFRELVGVPGASVSDLRIGPVPIEDVDWSSWMTGRPFWSAS